MAQLSSMMATISPGMTVEAATTGLVSVMKAYGVSAENVLDGVMSKINAVGKILPLKNYIGQRLWIAETEERHYVCNNHNESLTTTVAQMVTYVPKFFHIASSNV